MIGTSSCTSTYSSCKCCYSILTNLLIIDNNWYPTVARDNVDLVTDEIVAIRPNGIETADGSVHEVDVIIYATGFKANQFLWPMTVSGKSGTELNERWGDEPSAFKGMLVPDYPNLFCLYGPNTNIVHGGSIIYPNRPMQDRDPNPFYDTTNGTKSVGWMIRTNKGMYKGGE